MTGDDIAAVVVTFQSASTIDDCLLRLRAAEGVAEIRVVDNASSDATMEIVQRHALDDPRLRFIANPDNPGFAVACNQGAAASSAPWIAFVNPDLMVEADTLGRMRDASAGLGDALIGCGLRGEDGASDGAARRHDPDLAAMLFFKAARTLHVPKNASQPVQLLEAISGALMLLPRSLFNRVGGLDEGYRLHVEDLDFCRSVRLAGGRVAVANNVEVLHLRGVSSRSNPLFVEWHRHRGLWRYFRKFDADKHRVLIRAVVFAMIWLRFPLAVARRLRTL